MHGGTERVDLRSKGQDAGWGAEGGGASRTPHPAFGEPSLPGFGLNQVLAAGVGTVLSRPY